MMPKLVIKVKKELGLIDSAFDKSSLKGMSEKVFKAVYKAKLNGLYLLVRKAVARYITNEGKDFFEAVDEGAAYYILGQHAMFENFMLGDEKTLNSKPEYIEFKRNKMVRQVLKKIRHGFVGSKEWAIKKAMGNMRVIDFFTVCGITITWNMHVD